MRALPREHDHFHDADAIGAANGSLSNARIEDVYARLTPVYDLVFGPVLQPGRAAAIARMELQSWDRVLEVGVGTGLGTTLYPDTCEITGIDLSAEMLARARARVVREHLSHVRLLEMDASDLMFADDSFDVVYAPYTISAVPDPIGVAREMRRVCRHGGRILFLSHFRSSTPLLAALERLALPLTLRFGFQSDLDLPSFLDESGLSAASVEKVNVPKIWSLVTCIKD